MSDCQFGWLGNLELVGKGREGNELVQVTTDE